MVFQKDFFEKVNLKKKKKESTDDKNAYKITQRVKYTWTSSYYSHYTILFGYKMVNYQGFWLWPY